MRDLSAQPGNPAFSFRAHYQELMTINDAEELAAKALTLLEQHQGAGLSKANANKARRVLLLERNVDRLKMYLTNYILAADGHKVL